MPYTMATIRAELAKLSGEPLDPLFLMLLLYRMHNDTYDLRERVRELEDRLDALTGADQR